MALFGSKNKKETKVKKESKAVSVSSPATSVDLSHQVLSGIIRPRVTEKSGMLSQAGVYTFEVAKDINRRDIARAVTALYKVVPTKIAIINLPNKNVIVRGRRGVVAGVRKAMVTLKKGDKIDFV